MSLFGVKTRSVALKCVHLPVKLGQRNKGPCRIERVHTNGALTIRLHPGVFEWIGIRRLKPYREPTEVHPHSGRRLGQPN